MRSIAEGFNPRVLFVSGNSMIRAETAATCTAFNLGWNTRSAGVGDACLIPVSDVLLAWAEHVLVFEEANKQKLLLQFPQTAGLDIRVLDIPAEHGRGDRRLVMKINEFAAALEAEWSVARSIQTCQG